MAKYELYSKYNPSTYVNRDLFAHVCDTGDLRPVWAKVNSQNWGVEYEFFLKLCKTHCPCCNSELDYGLGKNNHGKKDYETPSTDHKIPQSVSRELGLTKQQINDIDNLWVVCERCNRFKNNATYDDINRLEGIINILKETGPSQ
jgi:hypothetical protein